MKFGEYARQPNEALDLLEGAVLIAQLGHPSVELHAEAARLDELAEPLRELDLGRQPALAQARALGEYLYIQRGFRGNAENYHEPENSFIDSVLERKLGIPISLALVYIEVSRRVGVQARGVGFPGHFLVRVDDGVETILVDPFFGGEVLDRSALQGLLRRAAPRVTLTDDMLAPVGVRPIMARMLINLKSIYAARGDAGHLLAVLDRLIDLLPEATDEVRDRGYLYSRLGAPRAALTDLKRYVDELPHAGDAPEIRRAITRLEGELTKAN